jgi:phosphopantetheinyl transferase
VDAPGKSLLRDNEVHLWALPRAEEALAALCRSGNSVLSRDEQACHRAIARPARARRYLLSRVLLREALAFHLACDPEALVFSRSENGKLLEGRARRAGLDFSLSHSAFTTILAVTHAHGVGVDLEPLGRGAAVRRIAGRAFPAAERRQIEAAGTASDAVALSLWTLKEAAVKAAGSTIWRGLGDFVFDLSAGAPRWLGPPPLDGPEAWLLALGHVSGDHRFAAALWRPAFPRGGIIWKARILGEAEASPHRLEIGAGNAD